MTNLNSIQTIIRKARRFIGLPVLYTPYTEYLNAAVPTEHTNEAWEQRGFVPRSLRR
jgi:hypothetical protein